MIAEHWLEEDGSIIFEWKKGTFREDHGLTPMAHFCCQIVGKDWIDIMTQYHKHMGWEPYKPYEIKTDPNDLLKEIL